MRTAALLTAEDFARVAPVLGPCELIKGEIVTMPPGGVRHSQVTARACFLQESHNRVHGLGRVLSGEAGILVSQRPDTVRGADVAFISYMRLPKGTLDKRFLQQPPELVIEVFGEDASWGAIEEKIAEHHALGVDLVWVLDPQTLTLRVYARGNAPALLRDTDAVSADPHVPGLVCKVATFFEE